MTPIAKNGLIKVVDAYGAEIGVTYLKRAKGLEKNGRARYIDEHTLQLIDSNQTARPPLYFNISEDKIMNTSQTYDNNGNLVNDATEATLATLAWKDASSEFVEKQDSDTVTASDILKRIDAIIKSENLFKQGLEAIKAMPIVDVAHGSHNAGNVADAISESIKARETTNQKTIDFLKMMYEDLRPSNGIGSKPDAILMNMAMQVLNKAIDTAGDDDTIAHITSQVVSLIKK